MSLIFSPHLGEGSSSQVHKANVFIHTLFLASLRERVELVCNFFDVEVVKETS